MTEQTQRRTVDVYTDGACSGNPGPGGWAAILKYGQHAKEISGGMSHTTNNRMELFAVISALGALKEPCRVRVHSDSTYVVNAFNKDWISGWQKNGWKTSDKKPVENQDLWRLLLIAMRKHEVSFHKVPGHADHPENNRCDELAKMEVQKVMASLGQSSGESGADAAGSI
ncbi:MAG: ribonuclease HI [Clostridiales bacterium]|mgnify:FL=1|nr:ribonuclease HI [Clostridiales bacterium]